MKIKFALFTIVSLIGLSIPLRAEIRREIVVKLPFEFIVGGRTLPAGTYTLSRFSDDRVDGLILSNYKQHISIFVYPVTAGSALADKPQVSFTRVGADRYLSEIRTAHDVFEIKVPKSIMLASQPVNPVSAVGGSH